MLSSSGFSLSTFERRRSAEIIAAQSLSTLGNIRRCLYLERTVADDQFGRLIVILADELEAFPRREAQIEPTFPRGGVRPGIIDQYFVLDGVEIRSGETFDHVQMLGRGHAEIIDPYTFAEANRVDHKRVAFPTSDRMPAVSRRKIRRMRSAVHINGAEAVSAARFEDVEPLRFAIIDELRAVRRRDLPRPGRRFASDVRLVADLHTIVKQRASPGLKRDLAEFGFRCHERIRSFARVGCEQAEV